MLQTISSAGNLMHELAIATSLVDEAQTELTRLGNPRLLAVHLQLGALSGVVRDSLEFCYEVACQGTPLQGSRLVIEEMPVLIECPICHGPRKIAAPYLFQCAECGTVSGAIIQGRELLLRALEIADEIADNEVLTP